MATRFYLPATGIPALTPAFDGAWEQTAAADRLEMVTTKILSSMTDKADSETTATSPYDVLLRQYISAEQWEAYSFSGTDTWKLQVRGMEDSPSANYDLYVLAKVITSTGAVRGTLISAVAKGSEMNNSSLENVGMSGSCQTVAMLDSDHVMLEIGFRSTNTKTTSYTGTLNFGDNSGADLPEDDTDTNAYNPWFELSPTLVAYSAVKSLVGVVVAAISTVAAVLVLTASLVGSAGGVSSVPDENLKVTKKLTGVSVDSTSDLTGDLTVSTGGVVQALQGQVDAVSGVADAPLKRTRRLTKNYLVDGGLEEWTSPTDLTNWIESIAGSSTVTQEATEKVEGLYSAKLYIDAPENIADIYQDITLTLDQVYRFHFKFKVSDATNFAWGMYDSGSNQYLTPAGTWQVAALWNLFNDTSWAALNVGFKPHPSYTNYRLRFVRKVGQGGDFTFYVDDVRIQKVPCVGTSLVSATLGVTRSLQGSTDGFTEGVEWVAGAPASFLPTVEWVAGAPYANLLPQRPESNFAGDLTVTAAPDTLQGQVDAVSDVADANLEVVKSLSGQVDATSDVADAPLKKTVGVEGRTGDNKVVDGGMEDWASPTDLTYWTEFIAVGGSITRESSQIHDGLFSCKITCDAGGNNIRINTTPTITLVQGKQYKFSFWYYIDTPVKWWRWIFADIGANQELMLGGSWVTFGQDNMVDINGVWTKLEIIFKPHSSYNDYILYFTRIVSDSSSFYVDGAWIEEITDFVGALSSTKVLSGQVDAVSDVVDANLEVTKSLTGVSVDSTSDVTGSLTISGAIVLQGQVDAVSDVVDANLEVVKSLAGQVDAVSDVVDADLTPFRGLTGVSVDSISDLTGDLTVTFTGGVVQALQGQVDAISDVADANLEVTKSLVGVSVDAVSDVTGDLTISGAVVLQGQVDAVSDVADANLEVVKSLVGVSVDAVSDVADVNLKVTKKLVGVSVDSISDVTGGLQLDRGIAGQVDAVSDVVDANLEVVKSLSGQIDSTSDVTGTLTISGAVVLRGQVDAVSDVADVNLEVVKSLVGVSVDAVSDVADANLEVVKSLAGQVDAVSDVVDADLTPFRGLMGVSVDAVSDVTGGLQLDRGIVGQVDAVSDVPVALLEVTRKLIGVSVDAVSDVTGTLAVLGSVDLAGQIDAISSVTGARPAGVVSLGGVVASSSGTTALLRVTKVIAGVSVDAISDVTGSLGVSEAQFIQGQIDAISDVTGAVKPIRSLAGTVDAVSGSSGAIRPQRKLGGLCEPVSSVNGLVRPQRGLQGSVAGVSSLTGSANVLFKLSGAVDSVSLVTGNLTDKGLYRIQGVVSAVSTVVGSLTVETFLVILLEVSVCEVIEIETSVAEEVNLDSRID